MASTYLLASVATQRVRRAMSEIKSIELQDDSVNAAMYLALEDALALIVTYRDSVKPQENKS